MIERDGHVIAIHAESMQVRIDTAAACSHCGSKKTCHGEKNRQLISLPLQPGLGTGDAITVAMPESALNMSAFWAYLVPASSLLLGALLGDGLGGNNVCAMMGAVLGITAGLLGTRYVSMHRFANLDPGIHVCARPLPQPLEVPDHEHNRSPV